MIKQGKALSTSNHQLEVYLAAMTLGVTLLQWTVLRILNTGNKCRIGDRMLALGDGLQIGVTQPLKESLPLLCILLVLRIELAGVECFMWFCFLL